VASIKDVARVADDLESLVGELRSELDDNADFERLIQIADEIAEHADSAAQTFSSVNETLMSRIKELSEGGGQRSRGNSSGGQQRQKAAAQTS
jgi:hypothetical protein